MNNSVIRVAFILGLLAFTAGGLCFAQHAAATSKPIVYKQDSAAEARALRNAFIADSLEKDREARAGLNIDSVYAASAHIFRMPPYLLWYLNDHKREEAIKYYLQFRATLDSAANPFGVDYLDKEFVGKMASHGDTTKTRKYFEKLNNKLKKSLIKKYPHKAEIIWYEADKIKEDDNAGMLVILNKMIENDPNNLWPYQHRAFVYFAMGEYEKALQDFEKIPDRENFAEYSICIMFAR